MVEPTVGGAATLSPDGRSGGDRIEVRGIRVVGTHGVLTEERTRAQPFEVDVDLDVDLRQAGRTDDLAATVNYAEVVDLVQAIVGGTRSYQLLEALADVVAAAVLELGRAASVTVAIRKLRPPLPADVATVGVRITRTR